MSSWHVVVPIAVFATTGCTRAAPAWVLGPVPLAEHDSVAVGRTLPETAASRPWKTIVALNGRDSARLYHLQGDSTYDVGKVDAEVAHTGVVTALYFEVGQSMPIKRIAERFRKYYGEPSHTCIPMTCASWDSAGKYVGVVQRQNPKATGVYIYSHASVTSFFSSSEAREVLPWPARDRACRNGILELCPRPEDALF